MGNIISKTDSVSQSVYENYYPKQSWFHPVYVTATGTLGLVGLQLYSKKRVDISPRINFEYLLSLSATFGTQLWNTFIACPVLTRLLPRHQYGHVESYLKPKYLFVTTLFTGINAYRYLQRVPMPTWNANNNLLGYLILGSFALNILNSTIFGMQSIKYMTRLHQIEKNANVGTTDIAYEKLTQNTVLANDPEYNDVQNSFYISYSLAVISDLTSFIATGAQIYLLAYKGYFSI